MITIYIDYDIQIYGGPTVTAFDVHLLSQCHHALILLTHREPWLSWLSILTCIPNIN